ncbi:MAG: hypothetical protein GVY27_03220 [Deinococcus-Thermus bacterium]|jgi:hypothetical protein|nr:hypothetical protein [Deinococcota bacterium]
MPAKAGTSRGQRPPAAPRQAAAERKGTDGRLTATMKGGDRSIADMPGQQVAVLKAGGLINRMRDAA